MLMKLIKHEWKGTYKTFLLMYGILFIISITMIVGIKTNSDWLIKLTIGLMGLSMFAMGLGYGIMVFWRYYKNLYDSEGYLMFTLPVQGWQLLTSKLLTSIFWGIITVLVGFICGSIIFLAVSPAIPADSYHQFWDAVWQGVHFIGVDNIILGIFIMLAGVLVSILEVYFIISAVHLPIIKRGRVAIGLVLAYVLDRIQNLILEHAAPRLMRDSWEGLLDSATPNPIDIIQVYHSSGLYFLAMMILFSVIFFAGTTYILSKKVSIK